MFGAQNKWTCMNQVQGLEIFLALENLLKGDVRRDGREAMAPFIRL
jgi:hypothetical protein